DQINKATFYIPQIHCRSCIWLLENLGRLDPAITGSRVDFLKRKVSVTFDSSGISLREVVELMASIGYEPQINLDQINRSVKKQNKRSLYMKMGVAGFAFGNVMLFSLPGYFDPNLESNFRVVFGYLSVALALPVLFYSSQDYLRSAWAVIRQRRINMDVPISIGILALFLRSLFVANTFGTGFGAGYLDSFTGLVFFLLIGKWLQQKTHDTLSFDRDYTSYFPLSITRIAEGVENSVAVSSLGIGDRILLRNQELIPADSVLISENCLIDYSFVTGESVPVEKKKGEIVYAGGRIIGNAAEMVVSREVSRSYLTQLWNNEAFNKKDEHPVIEQITDRAGTWFTIGVFCVAVIASLFWLPVSSWTAVNVFTSVLIVACPCALALSAPFTLGTAMNVFGRNGLYLKNPAVVERMSRINSVVFDKTGTLTQGDGMRVEWQGSKSGSEFKDGLTSLFSQSGHPLSRRLSRFLLDDASGKKTVEDFVEEPGSGLKGRIGRVNYVAGSAAWLEQNGVRVSADYSNDVYGAAVYAGADDQYIGRYVLRHAVRDGLDGLTHHLHEDKIGLRLLSGDDDNEKSLISTRFPELNEMYFHQSPYDKLAFIKERQERGEQVMMIGDGLNDAGALRQSDVGMAVTDQPGGFSPACDAIVEGDRIAQLNRFLSLSRSSMHLIYASFAISLIYNITGLTFAVQGLLSPLVSAVLMPLSSITIIVFTTAGTWWLARRKGLISWQ
ncbi:MAG TPA: heavy metal translocating P-type ATPase, partial [Balneolales bacterium]|nr:heavy metal translocating P-type ATPase [Balneolales bacterium]